MEKIRENSSDNSNLYPVVEYVRDKMFEYKRIFEVLAPGGTIKGIFEVQITLCHIYQNVDTFDQLSKTCENTRYKRLSNQHTTSEELEVSSSYEGEYLAIIEQIESEAHDYFKDINIVRIKIKSSILSEGILKYDFEKQLLWYDETNHFQLNYEFPLNNNFKKSIKFLRWICRSLFGHENEAELSYTTFTRDNQFILTIYLFGVGQANMLEKNDEIIRYFARKGIKPSKVHIEFIFYDSNIGLEEKEEEEED